MAALSWSKNALLSLMCDGCTVLEQERPPFVDVLPSHLHLPRRQWDHRANAVFLPHRASISGVTPSSFSPADARNAPHNMDDLQARWAESPRIVVKCDPSASNGPHYLGLCAPSGGGERWRTQSEVVRTELAKCKATGEAPRMLVHTATAAATAVAAVAAVVVAAAASAAAVTGAERGRRRKMQRSFERKRFGRPQGAHPRRR